MPCPGHLPSLGEKVPKAEASGPVGAFSVLVSLTSDRGHVPRALLTVPALGDRGAIVGRLPPQYSQLQGP